MNKKLFNFEITGFIFTNILGTLLHFVYELSGNNKFIALFSPVNESPWEHLKMIFFPFFLFTIFLSIKLKNDKFDVFYANYTAVVLGMIGILAYFYTLNGILGGSNEWVNISSFFVGTTISAVVSYFLINNSIGRGMPNYIGFAMMIISIIVFGIFTFEPPIIPLFQDPQNYSFGI